MKMFKTLVLPSMFLYFLHNVTKCLSNFQLSGKYSTGLSLHTTG